uniref:Uncharacterized protein n=1 Tax=Lactuca sativa TaxID=4236 RepID=A0A9R1XA54_LACSA|nr:hypothetical protein LSAT_V11C600330700 [Lactuca sativa]
MSKECTTFNLVDLQELLFPVDNYRVCFDRKALCLVTDLRFGEYFHPVLILESSDNIWIMETFPNSSIIGFPMPGVIHQAVAYPRMRHMHVVECKRILDVTDVCSLVHLISYKLL